MNERERPERLTTLLMISSPSPASTSLSSRISFRTRSDSGILNTASTTQLSASPPITEASALEPSSKDRAPNRIDLPAPVWPDIMIRPSGNLMSRESIKT